MMRGIYTAASGMKFQMEALNQTAANLANVSTSGYKRNEIIGESFDGLVFQFQQPTALNQGGAGVTNAGLARIDTQGSLTRTSNPLNVALSGPGYFQTIDANGLVQVTRNGDFRMDNQGFLSTHTGERVLGTDNQPIQLGAIASQTMRIRSDGAIMSGPQEVARLKVVDAAEANPVTFPASNVNAAGIQDGFTIEQGYLERSNVNTVSEMVNMIAINKTFTIGKNAITTQDKLLEKSVNDLGRVQ